MSDSAGILLYRRAAGDALEVLLVHPGGPFWARRDAGAWSIPKGEYVPETEDALAAARREFQEELGSAPAAAVGADTLDLGQVVQKNGKRVRAFALEGDLDPTTITSNTFPLEWPPRSGRIRKFPEIDRAEWFGLEVAREKLIPAQTPLLDRLNESLSGSDSSP